MSRHADKRVLLLGMGITALSALRSLARAFTVVGVVRPAEAEREDDVFRHAATLGVPVFTDASIDNVERLVRELRPDCTVASSYDRILGQRVLGLSRFVNVHYAPLPKYRGRANVNWAIINREQETAITVHTIAPGLDAGNVVFQRRVRIGPHDTVVDLYSALNAIQEEVLASAVASRLDGDEGRPQTDRDATYGCARAPADGEIDWSDSTDKIYALIRGLGGPFPAAFTYLGTSQVSIVRASPVNDPAAYAGRIAGRVVGVSRREGHADVLTGDGVIRIHEVTVAQDPAVVAASSLIVSTRQTLGARTTDLIARIDLLEARLESLLQGRPGGQQLN